MSDPLGIYKSKGPKGFLGPTRGTVPITMPHRPAPGTTPRSSEGPERPGSHTNKSKDRREKSIDRGPETFESSNTEDDKQHLSGDDAADFDNLLKTVKDGLQAQIKFMKKVLHRLDHYDLFESETLLTAESVEKTIENTGLNRPKELTSWYWHKPHVRFRDVVGHGCVIYDDQNDTAEKRNTCRPHLKNLQTALGLCSGCTTVERLAQIVEDSKTTETRKFNFSTEALERHEKKIKISHSIQNICSALFSDPYPVIRQIHLKSDASTGRKSSEDRRERSRSQARSKAPEGSSSREISRGPHVPPSNRDPNHPISKSSMKKIHPAAAADERPKRQVMFSNDGGKLLGGESSVNSPKSEEGAGRMTEEELRQLKIEKQRRAGAITRELERIARHRS